MTNLTGDKLAAALLADNPVIEEIASSRPVLWKNPSIEAFDHHLSYGGFVQNDVADASARLERFRPYIEKQFPDTGSFGGQIESPMLRIDSMQKALQERYGASGGSLYIKLDSHLPVSGSVKARGGIYQVLMIAETIAIENGLLQMGMDYSCLQQKPFKKLFSEHTIIVGSTGNLGLSIGITGITLGFRVTVHMSSDAREWKKSRLRSLGVRVVEHEADYGVAVAKGRAEAEADPLSIFIDDEDSRDLFLGYSVAAERLQIQLKEQSIPVDRDNPLIVYLPCGVGGGPGGITFGLKQCFGDDVFCFFAEPVQCPAVLLGLVTGLYEKVSAEYFGLECKTIADGLAVSRPSGLVCRAMEKLLSGSFTVADDELYVLLSLLNSTENLRLEPSALAGFSGYCRSEQLLQELMTPQRRRNATHLVWATGGSMVPDDVWQEYNIEGLKKVQ